MKPPTECTLSFVSSKRLRRRAYVTTTRLCFSSIAGVPLHLKAEEFGEIEAAIVKAAGEQAEKFYQLLHDVIGLADRFVLEENGFVLYCRPEYWQIAGIAVADAFIEAYGFKSVAIIDATRH